MAYSVPLLRPAPATSGTKTTPSVWPTNKKSAAGKLPGKPVSIRRWKVPAESVEEDIVGKCQNNTSDLFSRPSALSSQDD